MRTLHTACLLVLLSLPLVASGQNLVFGTPQTQPTRTKYTIAYMRIEVDPNNRIEVGVKDDGTGLVTVFQYPSPLVAARDTDAEVATLIGNLNTANLSTAHSTPMTTGSLKYRLLDFLCNDFPTKMPSGSCSVP